MLQRDACCARKRLRAELSFLYFLPSMRSLNLRLPTRPVGILVNMKVPVFWLVQFIHCACSWQLWFSLLVVLSRTAHLRVYPVYAYETSNDMYWRIAEYLYRRPNWSKGHNYFIYNLPTIFHPRLVSFHTTTLLPSLKIFKHAPKNQDMQTQLILLLHIEQLAFESHLVVLEVYGEHALGRTQGKKSFKKLKVMILIWGTKNA